MSVGPSGGRLYLEPGVEIARLGRSITRRAEDVSDWLSLVLWLERGEGVIVVFESDDARRVRLCDTQFRMGEDQGVPIDGLDFRAVRYEDLEKASPSNAEAIRARRFLGAPVVSFEACAERFPMTPSVRENAFEVLERARAEGMPLTTSLLLDVIVRSGRIEGGRGWTVDVLAQSVPPDDFNRVMGEYIRRWSGTEWSREIAPDSATKAVADALAQAAEIARSVARPAPPADERTPIGTRHLVAALLMPRVTGPENSARVRLREAGANPEGVRATLCESFSGQDEDDAQWRRWLLGDGGPHTRPRFAGFSADTLQGKDLLDIEREAHALAALVAARDVAPPLAVGLFGDWGTGKSFFMRTVRDEVRRLARDARDSDRMQRDRRAWKHVRQIEFNAWHYVEGNLWASLVEHVLRKLAAGDATIGETARAQARVLQQLDVASRDEASAKRAYEDAKSELTRAESESGRATKAATEARAALELAEDRLRAEVAATAELAAPLAKHLIALPDVQAALNPALDALGIPKAGDAADDLGRAIAEAHATLREASSVLLPLLKAPDRGVRLTWLGASLAAGPLAALVANLVKDGIPWAASVSTALVTGAAALTPWIRRQTAWLAERTKEVRAAEAKFGEGLAQVHAERSKRLDACRSNVRSLEHTRDELVAATVRAKRDVEAASRRTEEAQRLVRTLKTELAETTPQRLLARYLDDRTRSDDYRKLLGVVARIRDDFEKISSYVDDGNWRLVPDRPGEDARPGLLKYSTIEDESKDAEGRINRIVLFIDDLDRCPPERVVEVLEAVHLLLAFPLFVVVVAVDVRWVRHALARRYAGLLAGDAAYAARGDRATVADYLEKIFQIPIWVRALDDDGARRMLVALAGAAAVKKAAPDAAATGESSDDAPRPDESAPSTDPDADAPAPARIVPTARGGRPYVPPAFLTPREREKKPATGDEHLTRLDVEEHELEAMKELAGLLDRSPRSLKRFVNVYRLFKASRDAADAALLARRDGPHFRAVLFLFAADAGVPRVVPAVRRAAAGAPSADQPSDVWLRTTVAQFRDAHLEDPAVQSEVGRITKWLGDPKARASLFTDAAAVSRWVAATSRFGFVPPTAETARKTTS